MGSETRMRSVTVALALLGVFGALLLLHAPWLRLPYFWDEAGYYIPAALDFYRHGWLIPASTLPTGHTPLVSVYLALAWRVFGFWPIVTRSAMILPAAATVVAIMAMGQQVARREVGFWAALLLAASPLFFAQSSLALLDLPAALFTTLAVYELVERRWAGFAVAASLAVLTKETAIILLLPAWLYGWRRKPLGARAWTGLLLPLVPLLLWTIYYHRHTGFWTGNGPYLAYNLYSTVHPAHIFASLIRRVYEVFIGGFNWVLWLGGLVAIWWRRCHQRKITAVSSGACEGLPRAAFPPDAPPPGSDMRNGGKRRQRDFFFITVSFTAVSVVFHSVVGGAVLPRYLLPVFPLLYLALAMLLDRLPRWAARSFVAVAASLFVASWFINPPYPFPYEDNLAYADFVRLHEQAARFLARQPGRPRILTAWPGTDELSRPFLGYVAAPLRVVPMRGFSPADFRLIAPGSFDVLYLYSRQWNPPDNWLTHLPVFRSQIQRLFHFTPSISDPALRAAYHLRCLAVFRRRGQWVKIYSTQPRFGPRVKSCPADRKSPPLDSQSHGGYI